MSKGNNTIPETSQEQELARVGKEQWERGKTFRPLREFVINSVFQGGDEQRRADSNVSSGVRQAFSKNRAPAELSMARGGARPGSGAFNLGESALATDEAATLGSARGGTRMAVDNQRLQNLSNIVKMGEGQQAEGIAGLTEVTRNANQQAVQAAALSAQERAGRAALAGTLAGAAGRYYGEPGTSAANYDGDLDTAGLDLSNAGGLFRDNQTFSFKPKPITGFGG